MKPLQLIVTLAFLEITGLVIAQTPASSLSPATGDSRAQTSTQSAPATAQEDRKKTESTAPPSNHSKADTEVRPDAVYAKPSGQDSKPKKSNLIRHSTAGTPSQHPGQARRTDQTPNASKKTYEGNSGKKQNVDTGCSTAQRKPNGDLDCGTGGKGAVPGRIPK